MSKLTDAVLVLAEPVAAQQGCEIWDVEYVKEAGGRYLRAVSYTHLCCRSMT